MVGCDATGTSFIRGDVNRLNVSRDILQACSRDFGRCGQRLLIHSASSWPRRNRRGFERQEIVVQVAHGAFLILP